MYASCLCVTARDWQLLGLPPGQHVTAPQLESSHARSCCDASAAVALRFALPRKQQLLGLPAGQHVMVRVPKRGGGFCERPYNPTSTDAQPGIVEFLVKVCILACSQFASADMQVHGCRPAVPLVKSNRNAQAPCASTLVPGWLKCPCHPVPDMACVFVFPSER